MKYHIQNILSTDRLHGSCYPTVYACLLDVDPSEVPYFNHLYFSFQSEKENIQRYLELKYLNGKKREEVEDLPEYQNGIRNYDHWRPLPHWLWDNARELWLASRGYKEMYVPIDEIQMWLDCNPDTPYIASGISPRGVDHVVIYQNGKMIHDPHPSGGGVDVKYFMVLEKFTK
jgi:hypothetical protein